MQEEDHIYISRCSGLIGLFLMALDFGGLSFLLKLLSLPEMLHSSFLGPNQTFRTPMWV
jgi:hypothetical protein